MIEGKGGEETGKGTRWCLETPEPTGVRAALKHNCGKRERVAQKDPLSPFPQRAPGRGASTMKVSSYPYPRLINRTRNNVHVNRTTVHKRTDLTHPKPNPIPKTRDGGREIKI